MPTLRLFASAREAAGTARDSMPGATVAEVLEAARERYGEQFAAVLTTCKVWVNGEEAEPADAVRDADEVAILPPVSGGAVAGAAVAGAAVAGGAGAARSGRS